MFPALLYLPRLLRGVAVAGAVLFFAGKVIAQASNDIFPGREQIFGTNYLVTHGGNTAGATAVNEVNEKMEPAPQTQASVWFEWKATSSRVWAIKARFSSTGVKGGLAAYVLPENGSQMSQLEPAGACLNQAEPSVGLRVVKDQRIVLRVWTNKTEPSAFALTVEVPGPDGPVEPPPARSHELSTDYYGAYTSLTNLSLWWLSTEVEDARLELGKWAPGTVAGWFRWKVPPGPAKEWQLSRLEDTAGTFYQVLRSHPAQPGQYQSLTEAGTSLRFTPVPGEELFVRASATLPYHLLQNGSSRFILHLPCEGDDPLTTPLSLAPGGSLRLSGLGATPTVPLPPGSLENPAYPEIFPDVWVRLTGLTPGWRCRLASTRVGSTAAWPTVYRMLPDGGMEPVAAGASLAFKPEAGENYVVRLQIVAFQAGNGRDYFHDLVLKQSPDPAPINDEREGAITVNAAMVQPIKIDLRGATASAREGVSFAGTPPALVYKPRTRTVWYALDLPASATPHQVSAWTHRSKETVSLFKLNGDGTLTSLPVPSVGDDYCPRYRPDGSRIYAMIDGPEDRILLLVAPVSAAGDHFSDALPIEAGESLLVSPGAATVEPGEDLPGETYGTVWLRWTAPQTGKFHLSARGSGDIPWVSVFTGETLAGRTLLEGQSFGAGWMNDDAILTFDALKDVAYHFQVKGEKSRWAPVLLTLSRGDGASPYFYWRQLYPEWDDILDDPNADPDGDGLSNLMEMAVGRHPGLWNAPPYIIEPLSPPSPAGYKLWPNIYDYGYLTGPTGCQPFMLTMERSRDLQTWQGTGPVTSGSIEVPVGDPLPYVRFRVSPGDAP